MSGLARYFEQAGFATVLVGFVREHIEAYKPPRALWLDFPMGRPMGKPNDAEHQMQVIRAAFALLDYADGPVLEDYPDTIAVKDGRSGYALPPDYMFSRSDVGNVEELLTDVQAELTALEPAYTAAVAKRGRTTACASGLGIDQLAPHIAAFINYEVSSANGCATAETNRPASPRKGLSPLPGLKLVVEDLQACYTESRTHRDHIDSIELNGDWFWMQTKAGQLLLWLEAVSIDSEDKTLRQLIDLALLTPRFWAESS